MKTYILYTTSKSSWYQKQADIFAKEISKTKGRGEVKIVVEHTKPKPFKNWNEYRRQFPKGKYDGVILHFTPYYRRKWGMKETINGRRNTDNKDYPEFWICCEKNEMAEGYDNLYEFLRLLYHEHAHFDEDLDDKLGNLLTQTSVHNFDYQFKKIHLYHYVVDYRGQAFKEKVNKLMNEVVKLVKRFI